MPALTPTTGVIAIAGGTFTPKTTDTLGKVQAGAARTLQLMHATRGFTIGAAKETSEGNPGTPCLVLKQPGFWRFRWAVTAGVRAIRVDCKQAYNTSPYPSIIIKASSFGNAADVTATSAGGAGWVTIGPASFTATGSGVVWVELWNNLIRADSPCYFDHIVTS